MWSKWTCTEPSHYRELISLSCHLTCSQPITHRPERAKGLSSGKIRPCFDCLLPTTTFLGGPYYRYMKACLVRHVIEGPRQPYHASRTVRQLQHAASFNDSCISGNGFASCTSWDWNKWKNLTELTGAFLERAWALLSFLNTIRLTVILNKIWLSPKLVVTAVRVNGDEAIFRIPLHDLIPSSRLSVSRRREMNERPTTNNAPGSQPRVWTKPANARPAARHSALRISRFLMDTVTVEEEKTKDHNHPSTQNRKKQTTTTSIKAQQSCRKNVVW